MVKVLFISIDGMTDPLGQSQVIPYLKGLAARGFNITIISCEKKENFETNRKNVATVLAQAGIDWKYCFYRKKIPILSQRGNLQELKTLALGEAKKTKEKIIVHCRSYLPALVGLRLKKKYNAKLLFDMRGFWADERVEGGVWKLKNPVHKTAYRYFKRKEKELINKADHVVTLSLNAKNVVAKWAEPRKVNTDVIYCCTDLAHFTLANKEAGENIRKGLQIAANSFVLGYLGSLGTWYMLDEMLDFFAVLLKKKPTATLLFITQDKPGPILALARKKNIPPHLVIIRAAQRSQVPAYISCFNVGLFFIRPTFSKKGSSPTKMAEILACGIPIITNKGIGDCDEIISESKCGITVNGFTAEDYQFAITSLDALLQIKPESLRALAEKYFSLQKGISAYESIYRRL